MKEEDRKWFESVDWRLMKREFPIRGAVARLMGYGLVGGDEVTIQREVRRGGRRAIPGASGVEGGGV